MGSFERQKAAAHVALAYLGLAAATIGTHALYAATFPGYAATPYAYDTEARDGSGAADGFEQTDRFGWLAQQDLPPQSEPSPFAPVPADVSPVDGWDEAYDGESPWAACDISPRMGLVAFVGYDTWRSIVDGSWQNNGIHSGVNFGTRLGRFSDLTGIGGQLGASVGAYNWAGTDYRQSRQDMAQPQGFITYGLFRKANEHSNWSAAVVQDWMLNANFGVMAENPTLGQWRGQAGYAVNAWNEFGIWGTWRLHGDTRNVPGFGPTHWRPINQLNAYWHYKWSPGGADSWIWVGTPEADRLAGNGSLGDYLVGLLANVPLSDRVALYSLVTYMHPSAAAGPQGSLEDAWNFSIGLYLYPGYNARSSTVAGRCWLPQLPVANNGYFLVDTNNTY